MTYVVTDACIDLRDRSCVEVCPVDCIYEGARMMFIAPDECIDCAACEPVCPVDAIYFERDLPDALRPYADLNAAAFVDGEHRVVDPPAVLAHPGHPDRPPPR
jgi:NAD-dependent dihydropyrimidine dehydrogenase PreA subunit